MLTWSERSHRFLRQDTPLLVMVGRIAATACGLISALIIAQGLGPAGRGATASAIALFFLVPIVLAIGVPLEVRRRTSLGDAAGLRRASLLFALATTLFSIPIALACNLTILSSLDGNTSVVAVVGVSMAPVTVAWMCDASIILANQKYRAFFLVQISQPFTFALALIGVLIVSELTAAIVLATNIAGSLITFVMAAFFARGEPAAAGVRVLDLLRGGARFAGAAIAEAASNRLDQVVVLPLMGAVQSGLYAVAVTVSTVPLAIGHALGAAFFKPMARAKVRASRQRLRAAAFRESIALAAVVCTCIASITPLLVPVAFGQDFSAAVPATLVSLIGAVASVTAYVVSQCLVAEGRGAAILLGQTAGLGTGMLSLVLLAPVFGAIGAATASTVGFVVLLVSLLLASRTPVAMLVPRPADFPASLRSMVRQG